VEIVWHIGLLCHVVVVRLGFDCSLKSLFKFCWLLLLYCVLENVLFVRESTTQ
jgi:hypothetical protein